MLPAGPGQKEKDPVSRRKDEDKEDQGKDKGLS